jgi:hypothetical protein
MNVRVNGALAFERPWARSDGQHRLRSPWMAGRILGAAAENDLFICGRRPHR